MNKCILWKMYGFNCKKFPCNVLDVYKYLGLLTGAMSVQEKSKQECQWRDRMNPYLFCCHDIVYSSVVN